MKTYIVYKENSEREYLYNSARSKLKNVESIDDVIEALDDLKKSSFLGYLSANSMINEIKLAVSDIADKRGLL